MKLFKTVPAYSWQFIYLFSQIRKFTKYSIKLIEKLSRRHLINSSDVFVIKGFTVPFTHRKQLEKGVTSNSEEMRSKTNSPRRPLTGGLSGYTW